MDYTKLNKMQTCESYFKTHFPKEYKKIIDCNYPPEKFQEKLYWHIHGLKEYPICKNCGRPVEFRSLLKGYRQFCCPKCSNSNKDKIEKTKQNNIKKYGGTAPSCSEEIKNKVKQTNLRKYGVEWSAGSKTVQDKIKSTMKEKYGVDNVGLLDVKDKARKTCLERYGGVGNESPILREKQRITCLKRYGDENYNNHEAATHTMIKKYGAYGAAADEIKQKCLATRRRNIIKDKDFLIGYTDDGDWICKCPHPRSCNKCEEKYYITNCSIQKDRTDHKCETCTRLMPIMDVHSTNTSIEIFVKNILDTLHVDYESNRFILDKKQLDIWMPNLNKGIELNGIFHHSELKKDPEYHINKMKLALSKNIDLLTLWEDQIKSHPSTSESYVLDFISEYNDEIYSNVCRTKLINIDDAQIFINDNYLFPFELEEGFINIGLFKGKELVSLMSFYGNEIKSFCHKKFTHIYGGYQKIFNRYINDYNPKNVQCLIHNDIPMERYIMEELGFKSDYNIIPSTFFISYNYIRSFNPPQIKYYTVHDSGFSKMIWINPTV